MASRIDQDPIEAIELYCARIRIEGMFDRLKHLMGAFSFRFWSYAQAKQSRTPKKNEKARKLSEEQKQKVEQCWKAMEGYANCGAIALGILQMIAIQFEHKVWTHHRLFLRTRRRKVPSEETVKQVVAPILLQHFFNVPKDGTMKDIRSWAFGANQVPEDRKQCTQEDKKAA